MNKSIISLIKKGAVGILPTDTIYGLVGLALSKKTVAKIYKLKKRAAEKPFIILISSTDDLNLFNITLDCETKRFLKRIWPNKISVVLPCPDKKFTYLHRGTNTLAFRIPKDKKILQLLKQTGPLVAPSANIEGEPFAENIIEAKKYFGSKASFYIDAGKLKAQPSTLIEIQERTIKILRQGAVNLSHYGVGEGGTNFSVGETATVGVGDTPVGVL